MATLKQGSFSIDLGFVQVSSELTEEDRQCAWELYVEMVSRVSVCGHVDSHGEPIFESEVLAESLSSLYAFFREARGLMRRYPVGRLGRDDEAHLGFFIAQMLEVAVRPFLEKWQARFRYWWDHESDRSLDPFERQEQYPFLEQLRADWRPVRRFCREAVEDLRETYGFVSLLDVVPRHVRNDWLEETRRLCSATEP